MRASYNPQTEAETCAACHQDANDPGADHSYTGVISEPTYLEWVASPYADVASPMYASCADCHMPPSGRTRICDALFPPLERDPNTVRSHTIEGTTPRFLENAVEMAMSVDRVGDSVEIQVDITNSLTGHHVPTGVTIRNMILVVDAKRQEDGRVFEYTGTQTVHDLGGIGDPTQGYYASLPGKLFAKVNHNGQGQGPTFFTDATGLEFDNRIPALATDSTHYSFRLPGGGGTAEITAKLIYRRSFRFLTDAKQWTLDGHGNPLEDVAPPYFGHLMEQSAATVSFARFDADGDGDVDLCDYGQVARCYTGPNAGPPSVGCSVLDDDNDGDVDLRDFAEFQTTFGR